MNHGKRIRLGGAEGVKSRKTFQPNYVVKGIISEVCLVS